MSNNKVDMKLEVVVIPVSDVDRAKRFYGSLGWRLDADFAAGDWRVIQFTPPGSPCSVIFGKNVTAAAPGSAQGLYLIVSDIEAARADLLARGVTIGEVFHGAGDVHAGNDEPYLSGTRGSAGRIRYGAATARSPRSRIRTVTAGCSRRLPRDCPDAWTRPTPPSPHRMNSQPRSAARRPRMANMRNGPAGTMRTGRTGTPTTSSRSRPARSCRYRRRAEAGALRLPSRCEPDILDYHEQMPRVGRRRREAEVPVERNGPVVLGVNRERAYADDLSDLERAPERVKQQAGANPAALGVDVDGEAREHQERNRMTGHSLDDALGSLRVLNFAGDDRVETGHLIAVHRNIGLR
jgi:catechol 2,3-dioxygenase-like lactoylglutathione lyase family enzyme